MGLASVLLEHVFWTVLKVPSLDGLPQTNPHFPVADLWMQSCNGGNESA